jgi:hypothetical protein
MYHPSQRERGREREREEINTIIIFFSFQSILTQCSGWKYYIYIYIYIYMSAGNYHMKLRGWVCTCIHTSCGGGLKPLDRSDQKSGESDQISSIFFFSGSQISLSFVCFN